MLKFFDLLSVAKLKSRRSEALTMIKDLFNLTAMNIISRSPTSWLFGPFMSTEVKNLSGLVLYFASMSAILNSEAAYSARSGQLFGAGPPYLFGSESSLFSSDSYS